ncbi:unnamed protein product [Linum trigynum]|uniref:Endonuclease/exonuclease/phosphatase domain-containing protein n=1 Tax=Linum trigynum TaxID=586398 RepID=A0AAV2CZL2_9ROSI
MDPCIFVWNCRGAGSRKFIRVFKEYKRKHNPNIVIIVEPRVSGATAQNVIKEMGYDKQLVVDALGFSGGIWLLWNEAEFNISRVDSQAQFIHVLAARTGRPEDKWNLTAVYANPAPIQRRQLWAALRRISESQELPWILMGDFNSILHPSEKLGGGGGSL